ncbi:MAG: hypothetical protein OEZ41_13170 [Nitrospirota bacterium]|nr:hypothetical protein [Nitrospirota bacterium]MDH5700897.1 hypothetical protein [Nitrospirota bacterium]
MHYPKKLNLILLPGLDGTGILFQPLVEQLRDIFHVTVIAYPKDRPSSMPEMAEIVKEQLSTPEDTILLAESFSGLVALTILEQCAIPLRGIIFCAAFAESPRPFLLNCLTMRPVGLLLFPWIPGIFYRVLCLGLSANPLLVKNLQGVLANVPSHVLVHRLRLIARVSFSNRSNVWSIPCGYLQASQDKLVPDRCAVWFAHHFQFFNLKKVDGPHFLLQAKVQQCVQYILEFDQHFQAAHDSVCHPL